MDLSLTFTLEQLLDAAQSLDLQRDPCAYNTGIFELIGRAMLDVHGVSDGDEYTAGNAEWVANDLGLKYRR